MFNSRRVNNKLNHLHKRLFCTVYKGINSSYVDLLAKGKPFPFIRKKHSVPCQRTIESYEKFFKCHVQYFKNKNNELQFTVTNRFCERLRQNTLWSQFTKLSRSKGLRYDSLRNKEFKSSSPISLYKIKVIIIITTIIITRIS